MNTNQLVTKSTEKIQLVKGVFSSAESKEIILALIDQKINFHQKQRAQKWEQNHSSSMEELDNRIKQLEEEKERTIIFLGTIENETVTINGVIEMEINQK
jgi:adenosyl cobinamide kinase/adenosyl cobinamide phosphate guanylyltransferase